MHRLSLPLYTISLSNSLRGFSISLFLFRSAGRPKDILDLRTCHVSFLFEFSCNNNVAIFADALSCPPFPHAQPCGAPRRYTRGRRGEVCLLGRFVRDIFFRAGTTLATHQRATWTTGTARPAARARRQLGDAYDAPLRGQRFSVPPTASGRPSALA